MNEYLRQLARAKSLEKRSMDLEIECSDLLTRLLIEYVDPIAKSYGYKAKNAEREFSFGKRKYEKDYIGFTITYNSTFATLLLVINEGTVWFNDADSVRLNPRKLSDERYMSKVIEYCDTLMKHVKTKKMGITFLDVPASKKFKR